MKIIKQKVDLYSFLDKEPIKLYNDTKNIDFNRSKYIKFICNLFEEERPYLGEFILLFKSNNKIQFVYLTQDEYNSLKNIKSFDYLNDFVDYFNF